MDPAIKTSRNIALSPGNRKHRSVLISNETPSSEISPSVSASTSRNDGNEYKLHQSQKKLINLISKYLIIVLFAQFMTLMVMIAMILIAILAPVSITLDHITLEILLISVTMDSFANMFSVYLSFSFTSNMYQKIFHKCHEPLQKRIEAMAVRKVTQALAVCEIQSSHIEIES